MRTTRRESNCGSRSSMTKRQGRATQLRAIACLPLEPLRIPCSACESGSGQEILPDPHDIYVNGQGLLLTHKPKPEQEMSFSAPGDEFEVMPVAVMPSRCAICCSAWTAAADVWHPGASSVGVRGRGMHVGSARCGGRCDSSPDYYGSVSGEGQGSVVLESGGKSTSAVLATDSDGHA